MVMYILPFLETDYLQDTCKYYKTDLIILKCTSFSGSPNLQEVLTPIYMLVCVCVCERTIFSSRLELPFCCVTAKTKKEVEMTESENEEKIPGQSASYRDPLNLTFGCRHYKRSCKLVATCCNMLYTCRFCHDHVANHSMDRKATTKMMCMKCLAIQPIGATCSTPSCQNLSMAKYYCSICKLFDDEREIYHCPYCDLCRRGKGLGIDYIHCMTCNICMSQSVSVHTCREINCEDKCPICHDLIFSSSSSIKVLHCGHSMHSACFQAYTSSHYTCPICSKSLGDMQVYFGMLDALLAEEEIPSEHAGQTQVILCNDCEKRGDSPFHWLYHKCPHCGSFNTKVV